jgi:hypothetical protein
MIGVTTIDHLILAASGLLFLAALLALWKSRKSTRRERDESLTRLEEIIKSSELTNNAFFRSLELLQRNLESLLARAETTEQRLRHLMIQPGVEKRHHYEAAAALLSDGQDAARIAAVLNLPISQVRLVQELRGLSGKEKKTTPRKKKEESLAGRPDVLKNTIAAPAENFAVEPILLTDVVE